MHFSDATNYFFAMEEDADAPMLELMHNYGRSLTRSGYAYSHVAFTVNYL